MKHITLPFSQRHALEIIHNLDTLSAMMKSTYHQELKDHLYSTCDCHCQCQQALADNSGSRSFDKPVDF